MHIAKPVKELDKIYLRLSNDDLELFSTYFGVRSDTIHSIRYINVNRKYDAHLYVSCSGKLRLAVIVRKAFQAAAGFKERIFEIDPLDSEPGLRYFQDDHIENNFILYID